MDFINGEQFGVIDRPADADRSGVDVIRAKAGGNTKVGETRPVPLSGRLRFPFAFATESLKPSLGVFLQSLLITSSIFGNLKKTDMITNL